MDWTPRASAKLRQLWTAGVPTAQIGVELGCSKNAVIGRAGRDPCLLKRASPIKHGPQTDQPKRSHKAKATFARVGLPVPTVLKLVQDNTKQPYPPPFVIRVPPAQRLPLPRGAVGPTRTCQWTDCDRSPWLFCDDATTPGYSWCGPHKARVFASRTERAA